MNAIQGTWRHGQIVPDGLVNWPEGCRLRIEPEPCQARPAGLGDDEGPMTPEEIAQTLAAMDKVEPFDQTPEEAADLAAWEQKVNAYTPANMEKGLEDVFP